MARSNRSPTRSGIKNRGRELETKDASAVGVPAHELFRGRNHEVRDPLGFLKRKSAATGSPQFVETPSEPRMHFARGSDDQGI